MTSLPSANITKASWMNNINWQTSPPFRLRWLSKITVPFSRIGHLKNPLNENLPVLIAKDGQEVEEDCGRALLREMESYAQWDANKTAFPPSGGGRHHNSHHQQEQHAGRRESDSGPGSGFNTASWWNNMKKPHHNNNKNNNHHWNGNKRAQGGYHNDRSSER